MSRVYCETCLIYFYILHYIYTFLWCRRQINLLQFVHIIICIDNNITLCAGTECGREMFQIRIIKKNPIRNFPLVDFYTYSSHNKRMCEKVGKNSFFLWEGFFGRDSVAEGNMCTTHATHAPLGDYVIIFPYTFYTT